jgi:von Willebrand factor type A domain
MRNHVFAGSLFVTTAAGLTFLAVACSSEGSFGSTVPTSTATGIVGSSGTGGSSGVDLGDGGGNSSSGQLGDGEACASQPYDGDKLPLDIVIAFDVSSSMTQNTASGKSKFRAIKDAMKAFVDDPESAGIAVGMQPFPLPAPSCANDPSVCARLGSGKCAAKACAPSLPGLTTECTTNAECEGIIPGVTCKPFNKCTGDAICRPLEYGDLSAPQAFPVTLLPTAANSFKTKLDGYEADGSITPIAVALQGAVNAAVDQLRKNPGHTVVTLLATDGSPSGCAGFSTAPEVVAEEGLKKQIKTFAIGVFGSDDKNGADALDKIAKKGGTGDAFIIGTGNTTTEDFVKALNAIRERGAACDYAIPKPAMGSVNFDRVNVTTTAPNASATQIPYRVSEAGCGDNTGWYYDVDPVTGATPTKITLCKNSCEAIKSAPRTKVNVLVGCKTAGPN